MTNLEWLRTLPLNELAKILTNKCNVCLGAYGNKLCGDYEKCIDGITEWLETKRVPELKPCPFCGTIPKIEEIPPHDHSEWLKKAIPDLPSCEGEAFVMCDCSACISGKNRQDVIEKWNRRAGE